MIDVKTEQKSKVLFVDDEENILRALQRLLMDEPLEIIIAGSGREGLDALRQNPDVSLIVSDQRMPGMSGAEFLEKAKEVAPDAIRIVLTGYADIQAAVDAINKGGAYRYLSKPWKDDDLILVVRDAVERFSLQRENRRLNEELKKWNAELEYLVQQQTIDIQNKNKALEALNERLRKNFSDSLSAFSGLLELRDKSAGSHSRNVSEMAAGMARALKLPPEETAAVAVAALLHDIGKIGIPDAVLGQNVEEMTAEDRALYMTHPVRGQAAIDSIEDLRRAGALIRHHHERWDGTGFPDRLKAAAVPLGARIIALADYFDRTVTTFRGEDAAEGALAAVKWNLGKRFDPDLFPVLEGFIGGLRQEFRPRADALEIELTPADLKEGMVLSRDARSGTGLLLLNAGTELTAKNIQALNRFFRIDPSPDNVFVLVKR